MIFLAEAAKAVRKDRKTTRKGLRPMRYETTQDHYFFTTDFSEVRSGKSAVRRTDSVFGYLGKLANAKAILTRKKVTTTFYQHEYKSQWPSVNICGYL